MERLIIPRLWSPTEGRAQLIAEDGVTVLWEDPDWVPNGLADEGEENILNDWLREQAALSKYLACLNDATIAETDTMATMVESKAPGADGYNRQQILAADWGVPALDVGDMQSSAAEKTFGPISGTSATVTHVALVTALTGTTGKFLLFVALSATTTVAVGQSLKYTLRAKVQ
ncbi:MAG: phage tail fiber protein [Actinomycetota bacterium]